MLLTPTRPRADNMAVVDLSELSQAQFDEAFYRTQTPVLIHNSIANWNTDLGTPAYFRSRSRNPFVEVQHNPHGIFNVVTDDPAIAKPKRISMRLTEAADLIYSEAGSGHYIRHCKLYRMPKDFRADVKRPALLGPDKTIAESNFWLNGSNCKTPLHFDYGDNFLIQVRGRKYLTLFHPRHYDNLYPALGTRLPFMSRVNFFTPDLAKFPLYSHADAERVDIELRGGDTLYIPPGWWHAVDCPEPSMSVNYWWNDGTDITTADRVRKRATNVLRELRDVYIRLFHRN